MFRKLLLFPSSGDGREMSTLLGPLEKANLNSGPVVQRQTSSFYWTHLSRFHLKTETETSLRNILVFLNKRKACG
jgi:hypothetical protein